MVRDRKRILLQIVIEGKSYAVMAAMSELGYLGWEIFDHSVCNTDVADFIRERVTQLFDTDIGKY